MNPLELKEYKDIDELLVQLARYCIEHNLYREGNSFHDFSDEDLEEINAKCLTDHDQEIDGGYMFLDDENGTIGMIRLYSEDFDPKWSFELLQNGVIEIGFA